MSFEKRRSYAEYRGEKPHIEAHLDELERQFKVLVKIIERQLNINIKEEMEQEYDLEEVLDYTARTLDGSRLYAYLERENKKRDENK